MPVAYEELPGSPEIDLERRTGSGRRRIIIAWSDVEAMMDEIFPDPSTGYLYGAVMPGYPFLVAKKVGIRPFVENRPRADVDNWTLWHPWAELNVEYGVPTDDQQQQSGPSGDGTGPGGSSGSTGGVEDVTFVSHKVKLGGEFLSYPHGGLEWEEKARDPAAGGASGHTATASKFAVTVYESSTLGESKLVVDEFIIPRGKNLVLANADNTFQATITGFVTRSDRKVEILLTTGIVSDPGNTWYIYGKSVGDKDQKAVSEQANATVAVVTMEHDIEWSYVLNPPWSAVRSTIGRVNAYSFAGSPSECLLFLGADCSREVTNKGLKRWRMSYKFSEKNQNHLDPTKPMGWNHFLRPEGDKAGRFQRLGRKVPVDADGNPPVTILTSGMNATATAMTVNSTAEPWPQEGAFWVKVNSEVMQVNTLVAPGQWYVTRGIKRSTAATHSGSDIVTMVTSGMYEVADMRFLFKFIM
jgi:hypothetical protein